MNQYLSDYVDSINDLIEKKRLVLSNLEGCLETLRDKRVNPDTIMSYLNYKPYYQDAYTQAEVSFMKNQIAEYAKEDFFKKDKIREDIINLSEEITRLELVRDSIIDKALRCATFSTAEMIYLLEQFGFNYRTINVGNKTLLVPETFVLRKDKIMNGQDIDRMALDVLTEGKSFSVLPMYRKDTDIVLAINSLFTSLAIEKSKYVTVEEKKTGLLKLRNTFKALMGKEEVSYKPSMPTLIEFYKKTDDGVVFNKDCLKYVSKEAIEEIINSLSEDYLKSIFKPNKTMVNDRITDIVPALEIYDGKGIPFFKINDNRLKLNGDILNILPEEVLAFVYYYVEEKVKRDSLSLEEAINNYKAGKLGR